MKKSARERAAHSRNQRGAEMGGGKKKKAQPKKKKAK